MNNRLPEEELDQYLKELYDAQDHSSIPHYWSSRAEIPPFYKGLSSRNLPRWVQGVLIIMALTMILGTIAPIVMEIWGNYIK